MLRSLVPRVPDSLRVAASQWSTVAEAAVEAAARR